MRERVCLDIAANLDPGIALVAEAKDTTETVEREIANLEEGEGWGLAASASPQWALHTAVLKTHLSTHVQVDDLYPSLNNGRLVALNTC